MLERARAAASFIQETIKDTTATGGATVKGQLRVHFDTGTSPMKEDLRKAELVMTSMLLDADLSPTGLTKPCL